MVPKARKALVIPFDNSRALGRTPILLVAKLSSFWVAPRFNMGLTAHGISHYHGIVVVRVNRRWSRGVLRYTWADQRTASSPSTGQPIAAKVSWYG